MFIFRLELAASIDELKLAQEKFIKLDKKKLASLTEDNENQIKNDDIGVKSVNVSDIN